MDLIQFRRTGRMVRNISDIVGVGDPCPGMVYAGNTFIYVRKMPGMCVLEIENTFERGPLDVLEEKLFEYATRTGLLE